MPDMPLYEHCDTCGTTVDDEHLLYALTVLEDPDGRFAAPGFYCSDQCADQRPIPTAADVAAGQRRIRTKHTFEDLIKASWPT